MITCPICLGLGKVKEQKTPVQLTRMQTRIYDIVRRTGGIALPELMERVYASRDGGVPRTAGNSVWVAVNNANKRLAPVNQKIVSSKGWGSIYKLVNINPTPGDGSRDANR